MSIRALVFNPGLKSVRVIVFDDRGHKLACAARPIRTYLRDSWIEQDPEEWWGKAVDCAREVGDAIDPGSLAFVTVTASAACLVPVDARLGPLRRALMVSDRRSVAQAETLARLPAFEAVRRSNGAFVPDPYFMAPKILWLKEHEPTIYARTRWMLSPGDFLVARLTGRVVTDPLNAEKSFYDLKTRTYPAGLYEEAGLDAALLPPVLPPGEGAGPMTGEAAAALGLRAGTPVLLSTYDALCAFCGSGVHREGDVADVSGTVTSVRVLTGRRIEAQDRRIFAQALPAPAPPHAGAAGAAPASGLFAVGGSNNLGGGLIEWLKQSFYGHDALPYEAMEAEAAASGPAARGILFLPYLLGERCPIWDPHARGVFFGLERQHQRGDFARAVFESAAFGLEHILRTVREHAIEPKRLRVSGGLARIRLMASIKADVTGLETEVLEEFETAALGAFLIAGTGAGVFPSLEAAAGIVKVRETLRPDEERRALYGEWFDLYLRLYGGLKPLFEDRQRLFARHRMGGAGRLENL